MDSQGKQMNLSDVFFDYNIQSGILTRLELMYIFTMISGAQA